MKILLIHNFYQQAGGEDGVFAEEGRLLESRGHTVTRFTMHNDDVPKLGKLELARKTISNPAAADAIAAKVRETKADLAHFHNTFMLISPAAYRAAGQAGAAVVQTLHNYRLLCPAATFYRDGHVCQDCLGKTLTWPAVAHKCYRDSRAASGIVTLMLATHRAKGTYQTDIDRFIALTEFARRKYIEGGLPAARIVVKPNFVDPDPGIGSGEADFALFVGRFTDEKGVRTLIDAWKHLEPNAGVKLKVVGDGPLRDEMASQIANLPNVELVGRRGSAEVYDMMGAARMLIFPSRWFEGQPRTIVESFAKGTPVIASDLGSMSEMISHENNGLLFAPGDAEALAGAVKRLWSDPPLRARLRIDARAEFEKHYSADANYVQLMKIYGDAINAAAASRGSRSAATQVPGVGLP